MSDNLLSAAMSVKSFSPIHKAVEVEIAISPDPEDRETYHSGNTVKLPSDWVKRADLTPDEAKKWSSIYGRSPWIKTIALSNTGLLKILDGIDAEVVENKRVDDRGIPHYCEWTTQVSLTKPDGSKGILFGDYAMDLRLPRNVDDGGARYQEHLMSNQDKLVAVLQEKKMNRKYNSREDGRWDAFIEKAWLSFSEDEQVEIQVKAAYRAERAIIKMRPFLVQRAQTGSRNRAIRSLGIRSWYFPHELEHPIRIRRVEFNWEQAQELLGEEQTKGLLLALVERQFGVPASEIKALAAPAPLPAQEVEQVLDAEVLEEAFEDTEESEVESEPKPVEEECDDELLSVPLIPLKKEPRAKKQPAFSFKEVQELPFTTDREGRRPIQEQMKQYLKHLVAVLESAGYDNRPYRKNLLIELFDTSDFKEFVLGWFRLLERYACHIRDAKDEDKEVAKAYAKRIVAVGREHQLDWDGAVESLVAQDDEESIPL